MKNPIVFTFMMCCAFAASSQAIVKNDTIKSIRIGPVLTNSRLLRRHTIQIGNPCKDCTVLAIYNQEKFYSKTVKSVIDTLYEKYNYVLHFDRDTIMRYTSDRNITNVILIEKAKK